MTVETVVNLGKVETVESITQEAMERALRHAHEEWKEEAYQTIEETARELTLFTIDDVSERLSLKDVHTHDKRALGPLVTLAARNGVCKSTGELLKSRQKQCHGNRRTLWKSLICGRAQ